MKRKIVAVGDSHSLRCFENNLQIADSKVYFGYNKMDGRTAFKIRSNEKKLRKIINPIKDKYLIFVFGEVDVRIHIKLKHIQQNIPIDVLIKNTAQTYTDYIVELRNEGFNIHVFNVVPTGDFYGELYEKWKKGIKYPFETSFNERQRFTLMLNAELKNCCSEKHIPFIDIYNHLVDEHGKRKKELIYDFSHLNSKTADVLLEHYSFENIAEVT